MAKRLPAPDEIQRVRLDLDKAHGPAIDLAAARCGLSLASFVRLAVELLVTSPAGRVSLDEIKAKGEEMTRRTAAARKAAAAPKKRRK